ncbi:TPA: hypothetical protein ACXYOX_004217 [Escherichia coli]
MTTRIIYTTAGVRQAQRIAAQAAAAHDHRRWALAARLFRRAICVIQIPQEAAQ